MWMFWKIEKHYHKKRESEKGIQNLKDSYTLLISTELDMSTVKEHCVNVTQLHLGEWFH